MTLVAVAPQKAPDRLRASVLGSSLLMHEVVTHLLESRGVFVTELDDDDGPAGSFVAVLVDPTDDDWASASACCAPVVLVVDDEPSDDEVIANILRGADAVVHAGSIRASLSDLVELVAGGGSELTPAQSRTLAGLARTAVREPQVVLTARERQIVDSIAGGHSVKQTALALGISAKTVENLQSRLFRKLGVRNRAQAIAQAHVLGLLG